MKNAKYQSEFVKFPKVDFLFGILNCFNPYRFVRYTKRLLPDFSFEP